MQTKGKNLLLNDLKQAKKNLLWRKILPLHLMSDCEPILKFDLMVYLYKKCLFLLICTFLYTNTVYLCIRNFK